MLRTTLGTRVPLAGPVKKVEDADLPFAGRFCSARFRSSQGRHGHERQTHEVLFKEAQHAGCAQVALLASRRLKNRLVMQVPKRKRTKASQAGKLQCSKIARHCPLLNISAQLLSDSVRRSSVGRAAVHNLEVHGSIPIDVLANLVILLHLQLVFLNDWSFRQPPILKRYAIT